MANNVNNTVLPIEERTLTPNEVEFMDRRRRRGQLFLVISFQCIIMGTLLTLWSGQDLTYSPGLIHPMFYWNALVGLGALVFGALGVHYRRGSNEFISY